MAIRVSTDGLPPGSPLPNNVDGSSTAPVNVAGPFPPINSAWGNSSGVVGNATAAASLSPNGTQFAYLEQVEFTCGGATGASQITATITGVLGGPYSYIFQVPTLASNLVSTLVLPFNPPLQSFAKGQTVTASLPAAGSGNVAACANVHGFMI